MLRPELQQPSMAPLRLLREPWRGIGANPVNEGQQVVRGPLLGDFSVLHAIHVDRIPPDVLARRGDPEEVPLVCSLDDRADRHDVSFRDDVLLDVAQVREGGDDCTDQPDEVLATLDCSQGAAVPLHVGRQVVRHSIGLVLVERRFDERANDPLVFLQVLLRSHLAPHCLCRFGAHAVKLGWPIDAWLLTDDYFFAVGTKRMTYPPDRDDLGGVPRNRLGYGLQFGRRPMRNVAPTSTVRMASTPAVQAIPGAPPNKSTTAAMNVITAAMPGALTMSERRGSRVAAATIPDRSSKTPNT